MFLIWKDMLVNEKHHVLTTMSMNSATMNIISIE